MIEYMDRESAEILHAAAIVGIPELAVELERMEICDESDSLEAAKGLRPALVWFGPHILEDFPKFIRGAEQELKRRREERGE